jgi:hypothetical protein
MSAGEGRAGAALVGRPIQAGESKNLNIHQNEWSAVVHTQFGLRGKSWMRGLGFACALMSLVLGGLGMRAVWAGHEPERIT